ncbi:MULTISPECIES: hypothetical protein [unclassified Bartonella]|uniref:hypothetical protein n=1 Tax=unclassified Bartonella TaxID=2645622 RepID=UPI0035D07058
MMNSFKQEGVNGIAGNTTISFHGPAANVLVASGLLGYVSDGKQTTIGFQEDIVDCDDNDAVKQRIGLINGYLKSVVKEGWVDITEGKSLFDDCIIEKSNSGFVDYCLQIKANNLFFLFT